MGSASLPPRKNPPKVLIVEDEFMVALFLEQSLEELGFEIAATVANLDAALRAVEAGGFDIAILDINISGQMSYPVADALRQRGIPFFFSTGYQGTDIPDPYGSFPRVHKPLTSTMVKAMVEKVLDCDRA